MTLLSAVGDDCTTLAALRDATPEAKQLRFKPSVLVNEDGCGTRVEKAGYNWLCQLVMLGGYDDGLRQLGDGLR